MSSSKQVVIYHKADFDGIFCREIAKKFLPQAVLIGWDYGDPVPIDGVMPDDVDLYMLDISVEGLMGHPRLVWIDHHKSAMEKYLISIPGYRIDGVAACRLAWQYFTLPMHSGPGTGYDHLKKHNYFDRQVSEPYAVRLAGEYDIWDKRDPDAELFQHGLRSQPLTEQTWAMMLDPKVEPSMVGTGMEITNSELICRSLLNQGRCLQFSRTEENASIIKAAGFTYAWEGLTFLCCNHARYNSFLFTAGLKPEHDACFGFAWRDGQWTVSLYHAPGKEHHDLSLIASKYGGGGHRGACGFRTKTLPFLV